MKFIKYAVVMMALLLLSLSNISAEKMPEQLEAVAVLKGSLQNIELVMQDDTITGDRKTNAVIELVKPLVNFELITMLSAGKQNWVKLTPAQRERLVAEFTNFLINFYSDQLGNFGNQKIIFQESKLINPSRVEVPVLVNIADQDNQIIFKMHKDNNEWKVYDFIVQGVSLVQTYRFQFDPYLKEGRLDALIKSLNKK